MIQAVHATKACEPKEGNDVNALTRLAKKVVHVVDVASVFCNEVLLHPYTNMSAISFSLAALMIQLNNFTCKLPAFLVLLGLNQLMKAIYNSCLRTQYHFRKVTP